MKNQESGLIDKLWRAAKIATGSSFAILIAEALSLEYAASAGIITLLTVQYTKQATLRLVISRIISFILFILLAGTVKKFISSDPLGFGIYLLFVCLFSFQAKLEPTVSVNAVFGTHIFRSGSSVLNWKFAENEFALLIIGTAIAVLLNLYMPDKEKELKKDIRKIEKDLGLLLHSMSLHLMQLSQLTIDRRHIGKLIEQIDRTLDKAFANKENTLQSHSLYYIEYLRMRKAQCIELSHFYREITSLGEEELWEMPEQATVIAGFLNTSARELCITSGTEASIKKIHTVLEKLDSYPLPKTKQEFRTRFVLYHLMAGMEELTRLEKNFTENLTDEQKNIYLPKSQGDTCEILTT
jgi:uncharacterized membrane protein YgaE (UPF0421/DUF939 family)